MSAIKPKKVLAPGDETATQDELSPQSPQQSVGTNYDKRQKTQSVPLPTARPEYAPFATALQQAMLKNKLSASEVARRIWGESTDSRGYAVAKNRDRIGHYLAGTSYPEPKNLAELAKAVGVPVEELEIERRPPPLARAPRGLNQINGFNSPDDVQINYPDGNLHVAHVMLKKKFYGPYLERLIALLKENDAAGLETEDAPDEAPDAA